MGSKIRKKNGKRLLRLWIAGLDMPTRRRAVRVLRVLRRICAELDDVWNGCHANFDSVLAMDETIAGRLSEGIGKPRIFVRGEIVRETSRIRRHACILPVDGSRLGIFVMDGKSRMVEFADA